MPSTRATIERPDLAAYRLAVSRPFPDVVRELAAILGKKLTAYIGKARDVRAVERWAAGTEPYKGAEERLRLAFRIAKMLQTQESSQVIQSWFAGLNPELNDRVPIRLLRDGDADEGKAVLNAARAFLAGG